MSRKVIIVVDKRTLFLLYGMAMKKTKICGYRKCKKSFVPAVFFQKYCTPQHGMAERNIILGKIIHDGRKEHRMQRQAALAANKARIAAAKAQSAQQQQAAVE